MFPRSPLLLPCVPPPSLVQHTGTHEAAESSYHQCQSDQQYPEVYEYLGEHAQRFKWMQWRIRGEFIATACMR